MSKAIDMRTWSLDEEIRFNREVHKYMASFGMTKREAVELAKRTLNVK